jgi:hypothetical protein
LYPLISETRDSAKTKRIRDGMLEGLATINQIQLRPEGAGTVRALSRIGYELGDALADIIDNSLDAKASRVEVTFLRNDSEITAITVADDGRGMSSEELHRGMQFAGRTDHVESDLGTFGMGLKSASFSQCKTLTVISRQNNEVVACRWSVEAIGKDWRCQVMDPVGAAAVFSEQSIRGRAVTSGTLVVWERLDRIGAGEEDRALDEFLNSLLARLDVHLGLVFHRFIENRSLTIDLIVRHEKRSLALPRPVPAYNPFSYPNSGLVKYPQQFLTDLPGVGSLMLVAHLWPYGSQEPGFLLGTRKGVQGQGFYFYRNDRIIQRGGWNGVVRAPDVELASARVAVELPPGGIDVNVQKSLIQVTAAQAQAFLRATNGKVMFPQYLDDARSLYRASRRKARSEVVTTVLGAGVPAELRRRTQRLIAKKGAVQEVNFVWVPLDDDKFFELDLTEDSICLNRNFRAQILGGASASGADAVLIKTLLFMLLRDDFGRTRFSQQRREWFQTCNEILLEALKRA